MQLSSNMSEASHDAIVSKTGELIPAPQPMVLQVGGGAEEQRGSFSVAAVWHSTLQRLWYAIPLGILLAVGAGWGMWQFSEPQYRSTAILQIVDKQPYLAFQTAEHSLGFAQTQIELLRGVIVRNVLYPNTQSEHSGSEEDKKKESLFALPELRQLAGKEDPVQWITQRLKVSRVGQSELYQVSFLAPRRETAKKVVDAIVSTYLQFQMKETERQRKETLRLLTEEQSLRDHDIANQKVTLRTLAKQTGGEETPILDPQQARVSIPGGMGRTAVLSALQQRLVDAELSVAESEAHLRAFQSFLKTPIAVSEPELEEALQASPLIVRKAQEIELRKLNLQTFSESHKQYQVMQAEIKKAEAELSAAKAKLTPILKQNAVTVIEAQRRTKLSEAELEVANNRQRVTLLKQKIDGEKQQLKDRGDASLELEFAKTDLLKTEEVRSRIADRVIHLRTESRAPSQVRTVQEATLPEFPDGPSLLKKVILVSSLAFFGPLLLLVGIDMLQRRVFEGTQLQKELGDMVVSEIAPLPLRPLLPRLGQRGFRLQSLIFEESVNALRAKLCVSDKLKGAQVFVVASAVSGEGKSNLSAQLALSWAQAIPGRVLIIDADLRSPHIHQLFDVESMPGLAEVLKEQSAMEESIRMQWENRLFVMPAGRMTTSSPPHLFSGTRLRSLLGVLRKDYDIIIVDVPPILNASETLMIAKEGDAVLLCARRDYSLASRVRVAYERLKGSGVNVVGAVLNGAPVQSYTYAYGNMYVT